MLLGKPSASGNERNLTGCRESEKLAIFLEFSIDAALGIEAEKDDDKMEWLIIGGFIIGNSLGLIFDNFLLGFICGMIGLGIGLIGKVFKQ